MDKDGRANCSKRRKRQLAAAVFLFAACGVAQAGDAALIDAGQALFDKECSRCHEIGAGARNKVGPHLDALFGRTAGTVPEFRYSAALKGAGESGLAWDEASISAYVEKPRDFLKGNRMSYRGMAKEEERAALVAFLKQASEAEPVADLAETATASETGAPGFADIILQIAGDAEYGEYLSGDCVTCHQITGQVEGIPSIVGVPKDFFVRALVEYKTNIRTNEVMKLRVQNLGNDEIAALAAYFSALEPQ